MPDSKITAEDLRRMPWREVNKARREGQLDHLLRPQPDHEADDPKDAA